MAGTIKIKMPDLGKIDFGKLLEKAKGTNLPSFGEIVKKIKNRTSRRPSHLEINLVPDIKNEMIRTLKLRNLIFFICIVVSSAALGTGLIFTSIAAGQQVAVDAKKATVDGLSDVINSYGDLSDFLTIRDQLGNLSGITSRKKLVSRAFGVLSALIPRGADRIEISEINIDLSNEAPTFSFDAQADAGLPPYIDYNVLDSFKKSMQYMRYDYGRYVDKYGVEIPAYCMIENGVDGATLYDTQKKSYYAYWLITGEGCNPSYVEEEDEAEEANTGTNTGTTSGSNAGQTTNTNTGSATGTTTENAGTTEGTGTTGETGTTENAEATENGETTENTETEEELKKKLLTAEVLKQTVGYTPEIYNKQVVVKIWRTPQFADWYKENPKEGEPYMDLDGNISNVAHFESECTTYTGVEVIDPESTSTTGGTNNKNNQIATKIDWQTANATCELVPDGTNGIIISNSSNGRGAGDALVLRFSAVITLNPEVFSFQNKHMLAVPPAGRHNVTDSYMQIQSIFAERAADCEEDDEVCKKAAIGGGNG